MSVFYAARIAHTYARCDVWLQDLPFRLVRPAFVIPRALFPTVSAFVATAIQHGLKVQEKWLAGMRDDFYVDEILYQKIIELRFIRLERY